ncbi:MAG TPA: beta-ribofuranosylaminobenzene 5'-phosphate synthase family protein [Burkholderiaceae bacterium]|nr:beta-ribofuranosylaminobenzene 5'-phosphate synthase family protein [Burkholderiaceae bacterium]
MPAIVPPVQRTHATTVCAAGRLHLGFLDPSGTLGRRFGSIGLQIDGFQTEVVIASAARDEWHADSPDAMAQLERAAQCVQRLRAHSGHTAPLALSLRSVLPAHVGLGSGTQLALAVGRAFARWQGLDVATPTLAAWLGRGQRSGIGIAGFDLGGLLVDGGPGRDGSPAPLLARLELPAAWRIVVVLDGRTQGLSGAREAKAIAALPTFGVAQAAELCHQVLMRVLPGAASDEFATFAAGINRVQAMLGAHFAPAQDGSPWTSASVGRLLQWVRGHAGDQAAVGQSSWGPTGFAIVPSVAAAQRLQDDARAAGMIDAALVLRTMAPRNRGAAVSGGTPR